SGAEPGAAASARAGARTGRDRVIVEVKGVRAGIEVGVRKRHTVVRSRDVSGARIGSQHDCAAQAVVALGADAEYQRAGGSGRLSWVRDGGQLDDDAVVVGLERDDGV